MKSVRGVRNPITGVTDAQLRTQIKGALRRVWYKSARRVLINGRKFRHVKGGKEIWAVKCEECDKTMGLYEKKRHRKNDGTLEKRRSLVFEIDHVEGVSSFTDIERDIVDYTNTLIFGPLKLLCHSCHKDRTSIQTKERHANKK